MTPEERIVEFIDVLKDTGKIRFREELFRQTGMKRQYFNLVRSGKNRFTTNHINAIVKHYNLNANWVFGVDSNMFRPTKKTKLVS